uniref:Uncharacterized protein n=1 Tax=Magallana gigas TaxID=29159 RepID=K1QT77_MAGGI
MFESIQTDEHSQLCVSLRISQIENVLTAFAEFSGVLVQYVSRFCYASMASCCSRIKELWNRLGKLKKVFLTINIMLIVNGLVCIVFGALAHSETLDIDTDRIEPLMDTITLDCCGVNAVVSTTNDFDATSWCTTSGSCQATSSQIPKTCCLNVDENTYTSAPTGCHASVNSGTYNAKVLAMVVGSILPLQSDDA